MSADTSRGESEFTIFSRFSRAFSHVVRGDLSVITNEVSYLATSMPSDELGRVRSRCAQIAATVSKIAGLRSEMEPSRMSVNEVARVFGAPLSSPTKESIVVDRVKAERLSSVIRQMLADVTIPWTAEWAPEVGLSLSLRIPTTVGPTRRYASWSSFAAAELGERSVIDAVVADLIMRAHGWRLGIELEGSIMMCALFIPPGMVEQPERRCA